MVPKMLRPPATIEISGKSRAGFYADVARGLYTRPVKLSPGSRASGWPEYEVAALQAAVIAGKSPDEIRALVRQLEAMRAVGEALARGGDAT